MRGLGELLHGRWDARCCVPGGLYAGVPWSVQQKSMEGATAGMSKVERVLRALFARS